MKWMRCVCVVVLCFFERGFCVMKTYILVDLLCLVFYVYKVNNKGVCALDVVGGWWFLW